MKSKLILTSCLSLLMLLTACGKKSDHLGEMADDPDLVSQNITKFVIVDDLQFAFDFMGMAYHERMMKLMKSPMKHVEGATHGLMVTIMQKKDKKLVTDAQVSLEVRQPSGKSHRHDTETMAGAGMHHYAIHLSAEANVQYEVIARVKRGGRNYVARTTFMANSERGKENGK